MKDKSNVTNIIISTIEVLRELTLMRLIVIHISMGTSKLKYQENLTGNGRYTEHQINELLTSVVNRNKCESKQNIPRYVALDTGIIQCILSAAPLRCDE